MEKNCPACGASNRAGAKYCQVCGGQLPVTPPTPIAPPLVIYQPPPTSGAQPPQKPASPSPASVHPTIQPQQNPPDLYPQPRIYPPQYPAVPPVVSVPARAKHRGWGQPLADGEVRDAPPPRESRMPFDPGRAMVILSFFLATLGICLVLTVFALAVFIVLAVLGLGSLCFLPILMPIVINMFSSMLYGAGNKHTSSQLDFQVNDGGMSVSVIMYLKEGSSIIRLGDRVHVYGSRQWNTNIIRAHKVVVYESGGRPTNYSIHGISPWPWWLGLIALVSVILFYVWFFSFSGYVPSP